jgi:hypothetical protein
MTTPDEQILKVLRHVYDLEARVEAIKMELHDFALVVDAILKRLDQFGKPVPKYCPKCGRRLPCPCLPA